MQQMLHLLMQKIDGKPAEGEFLMADGNNKSKGIVTQISKLK
jgi:hypothetical protein